MIQSINESLQNPKQGEPVWGITRLYPQQGGWSVEEYLALDTNIRIEYVNGCLEFPPMPTEDHQWIAGILYRLLFREIAERGLGRVYMMGYRVQVPNGKFREPDVVCILARNQSRIGKQYTAAADLVVEVVSPDDPARDLETKRAEYAAAGIAEYWIADPRDRTLTILTLDEQERAYHQAGRYTTSETAQSLLIDGFTVEVSQIFSD